MYNVKKLNNMPLDDQGDAEEIKKIIKNFLEKNDATLLPVTEEFNQKNETILMTGEHLTLAE